MNNQNPQQLLELIVSEFYSLAQNDILIGYQFKKIKNFDEHIPKIIEFWKMQLLGFETNFEFNLINAHLPLKIHTGEVNRWAVLFKQTLDQFRNDPTFQDEIFQNLINDWMIRVERFRVIFLGNAQLFEH